MAKKKRITRKELLKEPDEFLTISSKIIRFAKENEKLVSYLVVGIVVVIAAFFVFRYVSALSERKAYALFEDGLAHYMAQASQGQSANSANMDEIAKGKFSDILKHYASTKAARLTLPLLADMYFKAGSYDKAIDLYKKALSDFPNEDSIRALLWNDLGYAFEGKKDYRSAAESFKKVAAFQGNFLKADAYFNLGRMYELLNNKQKALEAFERVAKDFADTVHGDIAKTKVSQLKG